MKDAIDNWIPNDSFVSNSRVLRLCENDIIALYRRGDDESDGEEKVAIPNDPDEYREEFEE